MEEPGTLTLPARHSAAELARAREIARELDLGELHVFWSRISPEPPAVPPLIKALAAVGSLLERLAGADRSRPG